MSRKGATSLVVGCDHHQHSGTSSAETSRANVQNIPQIEWACPPQFAIDPRWKVNVGSESEEIHNEKQRQSKISEEIYLRDSDIPSNPSVSPNAHGPVVDDDSVPLVPLEAVDEETQSEADPPSPLSPIVQPEETATQAPATPAPGPTANERQKVGTPPLLMRDEVIGTAVALVALIKSKEPGNKIDLELLIEILRNPGMLEKLMREHGLSLDRHGTSTSQRSVITSSQPQVRSSVPWPVPKPPVEIKAPRNEPGSLSTGFTPLSVSVPKAVTEKFADGPIGTHTTSTQPHARLSIPMTIPRPTTERSELRPVAAGLPVVSVPGPKMANESLCNVPLGNRNTCTQPRASSSTLLPIQRPATGIRPVRSDLGPSTAEEFPLSASVPSMVTAPVSNVPVAVTHDDWSPSVPFSLCRSNEVKRVIDQIHSSAAPTSPLPSSVHPDVGKIKKLIHEYGEPKAAQNFTPGAASSSAAGNMVKGPEYFRGLILQHGRMQENPSPPVSVPAMSINLAQSRPLEHRPCMYFNSRTGCRRGPNCQFRHIMRNMQGSSRAIDEPSSKRKKSSGGNFGKRA